jgi:hypothetical protein
MVDATGSTPLTHALLQPLRDDHCFVSSRVLERLSDELTALVADRPGSGPFRLTDYLIRTALSPAGSDVPSGAFAWSPVTARRALGLAAVRSLVAGSAHNPVEGVRGAIGQAISEAAAGRRPTSAKSSTSLEHWLTSLSDASRAVVEAVAVTWATRLWAALSWSDFPDPPTIGRDHWWDSPHSSLLALRSRAEVRTTTTAGRGRLVSSHLVVLGGPRRDTIRPELCVVALAEALRSRDPVPPGRIVGWWPDSGHFVALEVNQYTLSQGVATVASTLASIEGSRAGGSAATGAAA